MAKLPAIPLTKEQLRDLFSYNSAQFIVQGQSRTLMFEADESFQKNAKAVRLDVFQLP